MSNTSSARATGADRLSTRAKGRNEIAMTHVIVVIGAGSIGQAIARRVSAGPGIIVTPLARDELTGPRGEGYRRMIELSAAGRAGTPDEVGSVGALLMGSDGAFITGSDVLMDGGVTAAYWYGELAPQ